MLGQPGRSSAGVLALGTLALAVMVSAIGVAAFRDDTAGIDTVLQRGTDALLVLRDGERRLAVEGEQVPSGATVLAGPGGAVLATAKREVHLYPAAGVTVLDGIRQSLSTGSVIVDGSDAPGLILETPAGAVTTTDGALVRVDGGPLTRVGVLRTSGDSGPGANVRATGRRAPTDVREYYQVQVATGGLPGATTPLLLTGDDYELALARDLVLADRMLNQIRRTLVSTALEGRVVLAALHTAVPDPAVAAAAVPESERGLGFLIAASTSGGTDAERYARVRGLRAAGGSWGVVAAIVGSTVNEVGARLAELLAPSATFLAVEQQPVEVDRSLGAPAAASPADQSAPVKTPTAPPPAGKKAQSPAPAPSPRVPRQELPQELPPLPREVADPVQPLVVVLEDVVDTVLDLVDLGSSGPAGAATPSPTPSPEPLLDLPLLKAPLLG